jgi:PAS domain S-box-containing protein
METRLQQLEAELEALRQELDAAHEKQRAGDEIFRRFSDSGIIGIALFELSGKILFANEAFLRMIGVHADAVAAGEAQWEALTPPEWSARTAEALAELNTRGSCAPYEQEYLRGDGTRFWGLFTGVLMDGQKAVAFLLDVTQRKRADEALRFQASLLDAVEQAVIATDLEGTITYWNRFAEQLYGWSAEEATGRNILDVTPAVTSRADAAAIIARLQAGESWSGELAVRRKDGSTFTAWVTDSPIYDSAGALAGFVGVSSDITWRIEVEQERARSLAREQEARARAEEAQRRLGLLTEATGALIGSLNLDRVLAQVLALSGRLVTADSYAVWRRDQASGQWQIAASKGLSPQYQSTAVEGLQHAWGMPGGPLVVSDIAQEPLMAGRRALLAEEGIRAMLVLPLVMNATVSGTLVFYYHQPHQFDEIELKVSTALANLAASAIATTELYEAAHQRADQLAEADRLKDQFLAMLAHELRNPLSAIANALQVTHRAPPGTPAFGRAGEVVERQSRHMTHLVDQLLDVSRISRGKIELHRQRLDLTELVDRTCEDHRHVLEAAQVSLTVELPDAPLWVDGDPTRLRQALGNLLQNAAKFTDPGGRVTVRAGPGSEADTARVEVRDTGIGISPELLPRVFEPFVQADRSLDRARGGLGLGLALVKGITELHGGRVQIQSEGIGRGATLAFEIPVQAPPARDDALATAAGAGPGGRRILIIEDNVDAAETLRDLLELLGHQAEIAFTGPTGLEMARRLRPDIVLCDLGLPGMDGYAVAAALRQDRAAASSRLIAVSGYGQAEDIRRSAEAGFDAHLTKPVEAGLLQHLLNVAPER